MAFVADCALAIGTKVVEYLVEPVLIRPLRPIFCFKTFVDEFHRERENLSLKQQNVENQVKQATDKGLEMDQSVHKLLQEATKVVEDGKALQDELNEKRSYCSGHQEETDKRSCCSLGWTCSYGLSKRVRELTDTIMECCKKFESLDLAPRQPDLRQHIGLPFSEDFLPSVSADSSLRAVMEALLDEKVNKIGLYSAGGAGKTTLAKQIIKEVERAKIFDRVVFVAIPDQSLEMRMRIRHIRDTIVDFVSLGRIEEESEGGKASRLRQRLENGRRILIVLDDVSEELDLNGVGIPSSGSCKVLLTTNDSRVCNSMKTERDIHLSKLSEDEAWSLFKNIAGVSDLLKTDAIAKKVVSYCNGLPKALVTVGRALRGKEHSSWEGTLQQMKNDWVKPVTDDLQKENEKLSLREKGVQNEVNIAKGNAQVIKEEVETWLLKVERALEDSKKLLHELKENNSFSSEWHREITKKAMELTSTCEKLHKEGTFDRVAHSAPIHQDAGLSFSADFIPSKSARSTFNEIMAGLKSEDVNRIGMYGMGGSGKTTLAKQVLKEADRLKIFDSIVMVTISQTPEVRKIQGVIADFLNLNLGQQESDQGRASKLYQRFKRGKHLIILDDVWESFDLDNIGVFGIGDQCKGCKILLTTRRLRVCSSMSCQSNVQLNLLTEEESRDLFRKKASLPDGCKLNDVEEQIVGECKFLPIALTTVGTALRGKSENDWIEALESLKESRLADVLDVPDDKDRNAYKCLRLSYDYLKRSSEAQAQFLLLLCSLFPEDYEIPLEDLTWHAFGMGLFERVKSVNDARRKVSVAVQFLRDSCLLLEANEGRSVKMHDMVRDVVLWIGGTESSEKRVCIVRDGTDLNDLIKRKALRNCRAISFMPNSTVELREHAELVCPNLGTLLIFGGEEDIQLPQSFFQHMEALRVLDVRGSRGWKFSVPQSLQDSTDLRALILRSFTFSNCITVGKLRNLQVVVMAYPTFDCGIEAMLVESKNVRLLCVMGSAFGLKLPCDVVKYLFKLEELYTDSEWALGDDEGSSCSLFELNSLPNLVGFGTLIYDWRCLLTDFCFPDFEWYQIFVCYYLRRRIQANKGDRVLVLSEIEQKSELNAFRKLFLTVKELVIKGVLYHHKSSELGSLFEFEVSHRNNVVEQELQILVLECLPDIEHVWKAPAKSVTLTNLRHVKIVECHKLRNIVSSACLVSSLQKLELLQIEKCDDLQEVFSVGAYDDGGDFSSCFQELRELQVWYCWSLKTIFSSPHCRLHFPKLQHVELRSNLELERVFENENQTAGGEVQCPSLEVLKVEGCPKLSAHSGANIQAQLSTPKLRHIWLGKLNGVEEIMNLQGEDANDDDHESLNFQLGQLELSDLKDLKCIWKGIRRNASFSHLTVIVVHSCNNLKQLFNAAIAPSLKQLETLWVESCNELQQIIAVDDEIEEDVVVVTFPQLVMLKLSHVPNLARFCPAKYQLVFPRLTRRGLALQGCPRMITDFFTSQQVIFKEEEE